MGPINDSVTRAKISKYLDRDSVNYANVGATLRGRPPSHVFAYLSTPKRNQPR
jgi:hypothetical protein